jgi:hypothetical protein
MNRIPASIIAVLVCFSLAAPRARGDSETRLASGEEKDFYASVVVPAMTRVKKALPPAPAGWVVAGQTQVETAPLERVSGEMQSLRFAYVITYKRVEGVTEEKKKLDDAYMESLKKNEEVARPRIEELLKKQTETSLKLRTATRRKNRAEAQRLNDELDENGRTMRALHEEMDKKIAQDVEKYLIKDAEASIRVSLNDSSAELPQGAPFSLPGAAFALRREGERAGVTVWKEGQTVILYGGWQQERENTFRANVAQPPFSPKAKTVKILVTGDKRRVEQLLKQMNLKAVLLLMK